MRLSYVIVTRNRCGPLMRTLDLLETNTGLPRHAWEAIVVDNASDDDTVSAIAQRRDGTQIISLAENEGMPARNHALPRLAGKYVAYLDDDSYPHAGAIPKALTYLGRHTRTAALVANVILPDGSREAPAFPGVTMGGASICRVDAIRKVGGFAPEFFRQAEEYDLSFRLWRAGYKVERFEDITFGHDKAPGGRSPALVHKMDLRNNLILVERYLPEPLRRVYRHEFIRRYAAFALHEGHETAVNAALREARVWARREVAVGRRTLDDATIEALFGLQSQANAVANWARAKGVRRVAIADWCKNVWATYAACRQAGLKVTCLVDDNPAFKGVRYRGLPVVSEADAVRAPMDGIVLSNLNPAKVDARASELAAQFPTLPLLRLWQPRWIDESSREPSPRGDDAIKSVA